MQKWEYMTFEFEFGYGKVMKANKKILGSYEGGWSSERCPYLEDYLQEIGEQGWEVVGVSSIKDHSDSGRGIYFIAKRMKQ